MIFSLIQHAYEVLSDPKRREVYDVWAKQLQYRYDIQRSTRSGSQPIGGEDILLRELDNLGLKCDPLTQLVVTCEVCRRPATKQCWTCQMHICEFCTLKRHWKDGIALHWPLINSDHMRERLAKRELEKKRVDDAKRLALEDPNHRSERELHNIRSFKEAAYELLEMGNARKTTYDLRVARFYMWAQTDASICIACMVPTGYGDRELVVDCTGMGLLVQSEGSPAVIDRLLAYHVDLSQSIEVLRTSDNRIAAIVLVKGEVGQHWSKLFQGDPDGARCLEPPYTLIEGEDDVVMHVELPFWIDSEDVKVTVGDHAIDIRVRNTLHVRRDYWRSAEEEARRGADYCIVQDSSWCLEEDINCDSESCKLLTVTLVRPLPTEEEITWKKGRRQDNRAALRPGSMSDKGFRFFMDDEDEFGLEEVLQALCFVRSGRAFVPAKPWWTHMQEARWARRAEDLPRQVQELMKRLGTVAEGALLQNK